MFLVFRNMSQQHSLLLRNNFTISGQDYGQVECLQRKRVLAFVNHFVTHTAHFLSTFAQQCDSRLDNITRKICQLENELALLEFKLNSVSHLKNNAQQLNAEPSATNCDDIKAPPDHFQTGKIAAHSCIKMVMLVLNTSAGLTTPTHELVPSLFSAAGNDINTVKPKVAEDVATLTDPSLAPFLKMASIGVPTNAITQKMKLQGLSNDLIEIFCSLCQKTL